MFIVFPDRDFCSRKYIDEGDFCGKSRIDSADLRSPGKISEADLFVTVEGEGLQAVIYRADTTRVSADNIVMDCSYHK